MVRMVQYKTKMTEDRRVILEKQISMNLPSENGIIKSPDDAARVGRDFMHIHENSEEYMYMLCLNTKNRIVGVFEISHGSVNSSIVGTREVFQKALLGNAVSIILMHNHPSGDTTPSREDIRVTERLVEAGKILGVQVLDHIIIGDNFCSLKERGNM